MSGIWSENRYLNLAINTLLFMVGINFMHYGQLILPVICFLLFIDNRFQFRVNNPKVFVVLCLFAISFYAFSYKLGFYSVMGFCCPMAYYIGSNIKHPNSKNVIKILYLFAFSMACHVILNEIIEYIMHGPDGFFHSSSHYDFWTRQKIASTNTAVSADLIIGVLYYALFHENKKIIRYLTLFLFAVSMFYLIVIGRRTPVIMLFIALFFSFIYELIVLKSVSPRQKKRFITIVSIALMVIITIVVLYVFNLFGCRSLFDRYYIFQKFSKNLFNDRRFELYFSSFSLMPKYPFGGQQISTILGEQIHDLWIDIYDYAGVVSFLLMVCYSVSYASTIWVLLRSEKTDHDLKIISVGVYSCIVMQMFVEPVMTGSSLFLMIAIIINTIIERQLINEQ